MQGIWGGDKNSKRGGWGEGRYETSKCRDRTHLSTRRQRKEISANKAMCATRKARTKKHNDNESLEGWVRGGGRDVLRGGGARPKKIGTRG